MPRIIFALTLCVLMVSCKDEETIIPSEFATYVDRFVAEAKLRGKTISVGKLVVRFQDLANVCGTGESDPLRVNIDEGCWNNLPEIAKELLMFHELGHAILHRAHDNSTLPNGDYKTIMVPDPTLLYNEYTPEKRIYYLDELFGVLSGLPSWTSVKVKEFSVIDDNISLPTAWTYSIAGGANHEGDAIDTIYSSAPSSLVIHSAGAAAGFSYWSYSWTPQDIEVGSELVLKLKIKSEGLTGGGAYFSFRGNVQEEEYPVFFYTTLRNPVLGTTGFREYSVKVNYFPAMIDKLYILLFLDGTSTGTVYFDDIQVLKYN